MKELYELKEKLCDQLKDYSKHDVSGSSLEVVDKLAHAIKNIDKIIEAYDDEGSSGYYPWVSRDGSYRGYSRKRDSMGRYSRHSLSDKLRDLMDEAPDEQTRMEIKRLVEKM